MARTRLEIPVVLSPPPVVIELGPSNQTLPAGSLATLTCQSEGQPIRWCKDGVPLDVSPESSVGARERITSSESGTLNIHDLQSSDAGTYTCWAGSDERQTAWTATLTVASPTSTNVFFSRSSSDPMALPGSPSQPRLLHRTSNSLAIGEHWSIRAILV